MRKDEKKWENERLGRGEGRGGEGGFQTREVLVGMLVLPRSCVHVRVRVRVCTYLFYMRMKKR